MPNFIGQLLKIKTAGGQLAGSRNDQADKIDL
jgi:hypothetical protein